jgi:hypothetical protein
VTQPDDPALLREEIERTREEIVDTIAQLRGKADRVSRLPVVLLAASGFGLLVLVILLLRRR